MIVKRSLTSASLFMAFVIIPTVFLNFSKAPAPEKKMPKKNSDNSLFQHLDSKNNHYELTAKTSDNFEVLHSLTKKNAEGQILWTHKEISSNHGTYLSCSGSSSHYGIINTTDQWVRLFDSYGEPAAFEKISAYHSNYFCHKENFFIINKGLNPSLKLLRPHEETLELDGSSIPHRFQAITATKNPGEYLIAGQSTVDNQIGVTTFQVGADLNTTNTLNISGHQSVTLQDMFLTKRNSLIFTGIVFKQNKNKVAVLKAKNIHDSAASGLYISFEGCQKNCVKKLHSALDRNGNIYVAFMSKYRPLVANAPYTVSKNTAYVLKLNSKLTPMWLEQFPLYKKRAAIHSFTINKNQINLSISKKYKNSYHSMVIKGNLKGKFQGTHSSCTY